MNVACFKSSLITRVSAAVGLVLVWLSFSANVFAQSATESAGKGGTSGALPNTGSTEITYALFIGGVILFVLGTLRLVLSFRE